MNKCVGRQRGLKWTGREVWGRPEVLQESRKRRKRKSASKIGGKKKVKAHIRYENYEGTAISDPLVE